ncbi:hypothetical protein [Caballeronia sp. LZ019]|uniref:hypothetical protein n=1 Tax=Caballeronia sp. LZ019 TaxID=3038555 RepID=UPI00285C3219|nr:hypothetical protein [Caballeronia sp. LZ019]MDR5811063.1 hypothetical protein [Caballeronia sp. LZ019]
MFGAIDDARAAEVAAVAGVRADVTVDCEAVAFDVAAVLLLTAGGDVTDGKALATRAPALGDATGVATLLSCAASEVGDDLLCEADATVETAWDGVWDTTAPVAMSDAARPWREAELIASATACRDASRVFGDSAAIAGIWSSGTRLAVDAMSAGDEASEALADATAAVLESFAEDAFDAATVRDDEDVAFDDAMSAALVSLAVVAFDAASPCNDSDESLADATSVAFAPFPDAAWDSTTRDATAGDEEPSTRAKLGPDIPPAPFAAGTAAAEADAPAAVVFQVCASSSCRRVSACRSASSRVCGDDDAFPIVPAALTVCVGVRCASDCV